ncbi:MAG: cell division protein FtsA [Jannaschia helgolandensis]|jgi:cell division protein FtsA|uniref:Cell division protein FtsA n=1 Tax=Jannaschia helgolandensis TaxID=188906 RepID=A0A1H7MXN2_9RHOB|nr:cell division protein FtsA [Jannaschia helgolandensis]SEL16082.1 cell division protein FtsA [Jannaschia helgolandensis]|tara:strand:+ start:2295 stop:3623 length:1329 start_codon:yes stop_codon:yes gene_type:complete
MSRLFHAQRAMRRKRQAALQRGVVAILDVGTYKTACLVLRFEENTPQGEGVGHMAGQSNFRVIGATTTRSRGIRHGEVDAMPETERAIRTAVQGAQKMANVRVDHVIACFSGGRPTSWPLAGEVMLESGPCGVHDVARVLSSIDTPDIGPGREVLHAQPVNFGIDHRTTLRDPRGQTGEMLRADMHLLSVDAHAIENLLTCIHRCDLELAGLASAPYAAATSALVEDEKELGAACIDMGAGTTGISIFMRKHMVFADTIPFGGANVTSDISQGLRIPTGTAEMIKTRYGGVVATGMDDRELIALEADTGDWHHDRRSVTRTELIGIIRPRVEEILEDARARLDAAGFGDLPSQRIVLTGGASQIPGLDGLAARILGNQVRLGRPLRVHGLPEAAKGPAFAACVGLCMQGAEPQDEFWDFDATSERTSGRSLRRAVRWFKDNW